MITIEDKLHLLNSKIKVLQGRKNCKLNNDPDIIESLEDIESKIQALTNLLEML
jgi:TolA-binding protein